jgi:hypothetical protein
VVIHFLLLSLMTTTLHKLARNERAHPEGLSCTCGAARIRFCTTLSDGAMFHSHPLPKDTQLCSTCGSDTLSSLDEDADAKLMEQGARVFCMNCNDVYR